MTRRLHPATTLAATLALALTACGVVDDGSVTRIDPPAGLADPAPSSTSTTTPVLTSSTLGPATTLVQTEPARLYYVSGGRLTYVNLALPAPVTLQVVITALQLGPPPETIGLRNAVPSGTELLVTEDGTGVARVDLPDGFFDLVAIPDQRLVIAQIVLTLTDSRGIGQVVFDQPVPKPLGEIVPGGQPLTFRDYESLSGPVSVPTDSATTTPGP